ncbi:hypothetical protein L9F63_004866, partial [Diploptera punctata]
RQLMIYYLLDYVVIMAVESVFICFKKHMNSILGMFHNSCIFLLIVFQFMIFKIDLTTLQKIHKELHMNSIRSFNPASNQEILIRFCPHILVIRTKVGCTNMVTLLYEISRRLCIIHVVLVRW